MEGRYPQGLLLALTNCTDPSKEEEFNAWYNHMHIPDVTAPGIFRHALALSTPIATRRRANTWRPMRPIGRTCPRRCRRTGRPA
jgi:hypothetical protein